MFGIEKYKHAISELLENDFSFEDFSSERRAKAVLLRHDIDFSVERALTIARAEHELGVRATYFFMLSSNTYNLLSSAAQETVRAVHDLGHRVSLHFDPTAHADIDIGFDIERTAFERLFGVDVTVVSIHRPGSFLDDNNRALPGALHTYQDRFFKHMDYLSDSGGRDVLGALSEHARRDDHERPLHLLLHPVWWTHASEGATATLNGWLDEHEQFLIEEVRRNCRTYEG